MNSKYLLLFILLFAFIIRVCRLDEHGMYIDERFTYMTSQGVCMGGGNQKDVFSKETFTPADFWKPKKITDYFEAVARGDTGTHIVYVLLLKCWTSIFGLSDFTARFLSVIFGMCTIFVLYLFVKENFKSERLALIATCIIAIDPLLLGLNLQARSYSLSILLTFCASFLFFRIVKGIARKWVYGVYALCVALSLLNYYLNAIVFLGHGLYLLFFVRRLKPWIYVVGGGIFGLACLAWWLIYGGGQWSMEYLHNRNNDLKDLANSATNTGFSDLPTLRNIGSRLYKIICDLFITTNEIYKGLVLKPILLIGTIVTSISFYTFNIKNHLSTKKIFITITSFFVLSLFGIMFCLFNGGNYIESIRFIFSYYLLFANVILLILFVKTIFTSTHDVKGIILMFALITVLPQIVLIYDAISVGHTSNINQRYSAYAIPYICILLAVAMNGICNLPPVLKYSIIPIFILQLLVVLNLDRKILIDRASKYTTRYGEPRLKNHYTKAANQIILTYQKGDTIIYPSYSKNVFSTVNNDANQFSVLDAQITNLFLPHDANYIQRIEKNEPNKIIIKNKDRKIEIFDFQGDKYRY